MDRTSSPGSGPMEPPEIPPQTRRYRKEEWEVHRGLIVGLYPMQGMKLRTIKEILEQDHAFIVNERQLKKKIDDWKIGKNVQSSEMAFIVHKQHQRTLARKPTVFRARGQPVDPEKISRWQKGPGKSIEMNGSPVPSTPSDISYSPPSAKSPSPRVMDTAADPNQTASNSMTDWSSNTSQQHQPLFGNVDGDVPICNSNEASLDALMAHEYSPFEGRSPPPFTPRPSPSPRISSAQLRNVSGFTIESIFPAQSLSPAETSSPGPRDLIPLTQESMRSPLPADWSLQGNNIHQAPSTSSSPSKTRYREKEELDLRQRLETFELQHGPSHPASLDTMSRLANVLQDQGRLRSAEVYFRRVAESCLANLGEGDLGTTSAFLDLGMILLSQSKVVSAEKICRRLHSRVSPTLSPEHRLNLRILNELGICRYNLGDMKEAERLFRQSIEIGGRNLKRDDDLLLRPMGTLAKVLVSRGEFPEAEKLLLAILETRNCLWGPVPIDIINMHVRSFLGYIYGRRSMYQKSEDTLKQVLAEQTRILGPEHKETLVSQKYLAITLGSWGRHQDSETVLRDTLQKLEKSLGREHAETRRCRGDLIQAMNGQRKFEEAERLARELSAHSEAGLGLDGDLTNFITFELGASFEGQGRLDDALVMYEKAFEEASRLLGGEHLKTMHFGNTVTKLKQRMDRRLVVQPSMDFAWT